VTYLVRVTLVALIVAGIVIVFFPPGRVATVFWGLTNILLAVALFGLVQREQVERLRRESELQRRAAELEAVRKANLSLTSSLNLTDVLNSIAAITFELLQGATNVHIFTYHNQQLKFGAVLWPDGPTGLAFTVPRPGGLTETVARTGEIIVVEDMAHHPLYANAPDAWKKGAIIGLPLKIGNRVVGVMNTSYPEPRSIGADQLHLLKLFADQAALGIENARLYEELAEAYANLEDISQVDALTGIANRRMFDAVLSQEWSRAKRQRSPISLIMVDVDSFKNYNDTYGHQAGDECLRKIAEVLRRTAHRATDLAARYGGEEFAVLLPLTEKEGAIYVAETIRGEVEELRLPHAASGVTPWVTVSVGVAFTVPELSQPHETLIADADSALYQAKHSGRNRVQLVSK
jgi:diguanylate cyclase (GGDEF)-like protein